MHYRLSLTPRLLVLGGVSLLMLVTLLFLLGVGVGRSLPPQTADGHASEMPAYAASQVARAASMAHRTASQAAGRALKSVQADLVKGKP